MVCTKIFAPLKRTNYTLAVLSKKHQTKPTKSSEQGVRGIQVPNDCPKPQGEKMPNGEGK